jgi:predicted protein tyrosine phosphatase
LERSACGRGAGPQTPLTPEQIDWADIIFVMEKTHLSKLSKRFKKHLNGKRVVCLDIPDDYEYMQAELVKLLEARVGKFLR